MKKALYWRNLTIRLHSIVESLFVEFERLLTAGEANRWVASRRERKVFRFSGSIGGCDRSACGGLRCQLARRSRYCKSSSSCGAMCFSFSAKLLPNPALQRTDSVFSTPIRVDRPPLNVAVIRLR
jgi:hypothetical protein